MKKKKLPASTGTLHPSETPPICYCEEEEEKSSHVFEKKRRLALEQVKELEKSFELDNKLDPETKMKLAMELGLHSRQVAVWFQNRRARWKTKQLERDYGALKADHASLFLEMEKLRHENQAFLKEIEELKYFLKEDCKNDTKEEKEEKTKLDDTKRETFDSDSSGIMNAGSPTAAVSSSAVILPPVLDSLDENLYQESCSSLFSVDQAPTLHWYSSDDWN